MGVLLAFLAWTLVAFAVGLVVGRAVRLADDHAASLARSATPAPVRTDVLL